MHSSQCCSQLAMHGIPRGLPDLQVRYHPYLIVSHPSVHLCLYVLKDDIIQSTTLSATFGVLHWSCVLPLFIMSLPLNFCTHSHFSGPAWFIIVSHLNEKEVKTRRRTERNVEEQVNQLRNRCFTNTGGLVETVKFTAIESICLCLHHAWVGIGVCYVLTICTPAIVFETSCLWFGLLCVSLEVLKR